MWSVVFVGFMQLIALKTRSAAATNWRPDLLPAAVPDPELRAARPAHAPDGDRGHDQSGDLRVEALRSLVLVDLDWTDIGQGFAVVAISAR